MLCSAMQCYAMRYAMLCYASGNIVMSLLAMLCCALNWIRFYFSELNIMNHDLLRPAQSIFNPTFYFLSLKVSFYHQSEFFYQ